MWIIIFGLLILLIAFEILLGLGILFLFANLVMNIVIIISTKIKYQGKDN